MLFQELLNRQKTSVYVPAVNVTGTNLHQYPVMETTKTVDLAVVVRLTDGWTRFCYR